jgi:hypothetical protein
VISFAGVSEKGTYHSPRSRAANEVKLSVDITNLIARLPRRTEEGNDDTVRILQLLNRVVSVTGAMEKKCSEAHKDVGAVGAWSPAISGTVWTVEDAATLEMRGQSV